MPLVVEDQPFEIGNYVLLLSSIIAILISAVPFCMSAKKAGRRNHVKMDGERSSSSACARASNHGDEKSHHVASLIAYARSNWETNPTNALTALLEATAMNSGRESADLAMDRIRSELGDDVANHIKDVQGRRERAAQAVRDMMEDDSTVLAEGGRQDLLRQAMEDGSSVMCTRCQGLIPAGRWQQHQRFWCEASGNGSDNEEQY